MAITMTNAVAVFSIIVLGLTIRCAILRIIPSIPLAQGAKGDPRVEQQFASVTGDQLHP